VQQAVDTKRECAPLRCRCPRSTNVRCSKRWIPGLKAQRSCAVAREDTTSGAASCRNISRWRLLLCLGPRRLTLGAVSRRDISRLRIVAVPYPKRHQRQVQQAVDTIREGALLRCRSPRSTNVRCSKRKASCSKANCSCAVAQEATTPGAASCRHQARRRTVAVP